MSAAAKKSARSPRHRGGQRGKWICGRWYPRWRLEEVGEKYGALPDVEQLEDELKERTV